jgi:hypothetical protein
MNQKCGLLLLASLWFSGGAFASEDTSSAESPATNATASTKALKKARTKKGVGIGLTVTGVTIAGSGVLLAASGALSAPCDTRQYPDCGTGSLFMVVGGAALGLLSIPFWASGVPVWMSGKRQLEELEGGAATLRVQPLPQGAKLALDMRF